MSTWSAESQAAIDRSKAALAALNEPEQGLDACACGCKYWHDDAAGVWSCYDCGDRFRPTT
jgi:hypothetical protein